jgi:uncharacterized membrane protein
MNWAYFHLFLNHFPIIGVLIGTCILIAGMFFKNQGVTLSGLATNVFAALTAILAYLTGDPAEKAVKGFPDVAQSLMSRHENIATVAMYLLIPAGLLAAVTFYSIVKKDRSVRFLVIITLVMSVIGSAGMIYTGRTGGQIRHSEFRDAATKNYVIEHQNDTIDEDE